MPLQNCSLCLVGDFNMPFARWNYNNKNEPSCAIKPNFPLRMHNDIINNISDTLDFLNLSQYNNFPNKVGSILDLVLCNFSNLNLDLCLDPLLPVDEFHPTLKLTLNVNDSVTPNNKCNSLYSFSKYDFKNAHYGEIMRLLDEVDWESALNVTDVNKAIDIFYYYIYSALNLCVPLKVIRHNNYQPWFTHELRMLVKDKKNCALKV